MLRDIYTNCKIINEVINIIIRYDDSDNNNDDDKYKQVVDMKEVNPKWCYVIYNKVVLFGLGLFLFI